MATPEIILERVIELAQPVEASALESRLQRLCDVLLELVGGEHTSVRLLGSLGWELLSGARAGLGADRPPAPFDRREGVLGWVMTRGELADVADASQDPRFIRKPSQGFDIGSMLAIPLWSGDEVVGVVTAASSAARAFDERQRELSRVLVNVASPAIALARLRRLAGTA